MQELAFERVNKHRALAEVVAYNRNWLPWWLTTAVIGDFCDQAERYLRGEGLPPLPVRLWWAYKHWKFRKAQRRSWITKRSSPVDTMQVSAITGDRSTPAAVIPVAEGQHVSFIPVVYKQAHEIEVTDKVSIDATMLRQRRPTDLGSFPRPNCPKCHTPNPELGTPLDNGKPSGWGDSFFTCTNWKCKHKWLWRKVFPLLVENNNKQGTVTGTLIKGTNIPFHIFGQAGATIEQVNEAVRKIANVAGISMMTPEQQVKMQEIIQEPHDNSCNFNGLPLVKLTNAESGSR